MHSSSSLLSDVPKRFLNYYYKPQVLGTGSKARTARELQFLVVEAGKPFQITFEDDGYVKLQKGSCYWRSATDTASIFGSTNGSLSFQSSYFYTTQVKGLTSNDDKTLDFWPGLYHEILNEPESEEVIARYVSWLERHL